MIRHVKTRKISRTACWFVVAALLPVAGVSQPAPASRAVERRPVADVTAKAERTASGKTRLSVRPPKQAATGYRLLDAAGKEVGGSAVRNGAIEAEVEPQRAYILSPTVSHRQALTKDGLEMPARYITFARDGQMLLGGLFLRPTRVPLVWDTALSAYATELVVGYEFQDGAERPLAAPKTVTFFTEGADARIEADTIRIERSGGSGYKRVRLTTRQREGETLFTARAGPADELKSSIAVYREPTAFRLNLAPAEIPALGIGTGSLTVSLLAQDGMPIAPATAFNVQLSSRRLRHPSLIVVPAGMDSAQVEVRSVGVGADEIMAVSGALRASHPVRLIFPVAVSVATLLGGACGGAARYLRNRRKRGTLLPRRIAEGTLVGVIVVAAAWAGLLIIDFSAGVLGTPFGAFVLAALAGYLGCVLLDRVAGKTFGGLTATPERPS